MTGDNFQLDPSDANDQSRALPMIIGDIAEQIWFVRDYVMLITDQSSITLITDPQIVMDGVTHQFPEAGSRDALCAVIERKLEDARQLADATVEMTFEGGIVVRVGRWADYPDREFIYIQERNW